MGISGPVPRDPVHRYVPNVNMTSDASCTLSSQNLWILRNPSLTSVRTYGRRHAYAHHFLTVSSSIKGFAGLVQHVRKIAQWLNMVASFLSYCNNHSTHQGLKNGNLFQHDRVFTFSLIFSKTVRNRAKRGKRRMSTKYRIHRSAFTAFDDTYPQPKNHFNRATVRPGRNHRVERGPHKKWPHADRNCKILPKAYHRGMLQCGPVGRARNLCPVF